MAPSALNTAALRKHQELVKINLRVLQQHIAPNPQREADTGCSEEVAPAPQPGRGITRRYARRR